MQTAFHSPFLQALGYAIANSLWQMALVWIVFSVLNIILKPSAANKFRLAFAAQLTGFIWFIITLQFYFIKCNDVFAANQSLLQTSNVSYIFPESGNSISSFFLNALIKAEQLLPFLSFAYLLLLFILLIKFSRQYYQTQFIRSNGLQEIDEPWKQFVEDVATKLNIRNSIEIYVSELINSPLTIGFVKPIILVPIASINHLSVSQLEAVLLHEMAHIKRYDYFLNIFISVIETALFFNPFTQLISKIIKRERENCCDDWVLQFQYNPAMYAEALLQIAYLSNNESLNISSLSMNAAKQNGDLLSRVKRMIGVNDNRFKYRNQLLSLLLITCILSSIAWFHPSSFSKKQSTVVSKKAETVVVEPMTAKIDNPLFNPVFFLKKPLQKEVEKSLKIAIQSIDVSDKFLKKTNETIASIAPSAIQAIENVDMDETDKEIQNSFENNNLNKQYYVRKINLDTIAIKKSIEAAFRTNKLFSLEKVNSELKKAKREYEKMMSQNRIPFEQQQKEQEEFQKALMELDHLKIPFIEKTFEPRFKKELNIMMKKIDSLRIKIQTPKINDDNDEMSVSSEASSLALNHPLEKNSSPKSFTITTSISNNKHNLNSNNKHLEIIFSPDEDKEPIKIYFELNKD